VFGAIAHFERRLISERTKDGIASARLKGKIPGRPNLDKEKLSSALKLIESGLSLTNVAKQLNIGRSTIYRELKFAVTTANISIFILSFFSTNYTTHFIIITSLNCSLIICCTQL
jgi:DNA invertase Pin-like site-specific DNA recombinase